MSKKKSWLFVGIVFACVIIALFIAAKVKEHVPSWGPFEKELKQNYDYVCDAFYQPRPVTTREIRLGIMLKREITESEFLDVSRFVRSYLESEIVIEEFMQYFERMRDRALGAAFVDIYLVPATDFEYTIAARLEPDHTFQNWAVSFKGHGFEKLEPEN